MTFKRASFYGISKFLASVFLMVFLAPHSLANGKDEINFDFLDFDPCKNVTPFKDFFQCRLKNLAPEILEDLAERPQPVREVFRHENYEAYINLHPPKIPTEVGHFQSASDFEKAKVTEGQLDRVYKHPTRPIFYFIFESRTAEHITVEGISTYVESFKSHILQGHDLWVHLAMRDSIIDGDGSGIDLRSSDIARFFAEAGRTKVQLNAAENAFYKQLQDLGILSPTGTAIGEAAVLAVSEDAVDNVRIHELNHGYYFTDQAYQKACRQLFDSLPKVDQDRIIKLLELSPYYDFKNDVDLVIREYIATFRDVEYFIKGNVQPSQQGSEGNLKFLREQSSRIIELDDLIPEYRN